MQGSVKKASTGMVVLAFAIVYIVWGSTYFFIAEALEGFPPFVIGAFRFFTAAVIMLIWCLYKKEKVFNLRQMKNAAFSGLLLLFIGNGGVMWVEQSLPSAVVAITVSTAPFWFLLLDKPKWKENFRSKSTIVGLFTGFIGVVLLFYKSVVATVAGENATEAIGMVIVTLAAISWAGGSLYSKYYNSEGSAAVNSMWQMFTASIAFTITAVYRGEMQAVDFSVVSGSAWFALIYLIVLGSVAGYSAYVWLLEVRPATQVSTYAYVNPVVAVLMGIIFANEQISFLQGLGLAVILGSVLMINLAKRIRKAN